MTQLHVRAEPGAIAPVVLLPGDPDRATLIAETLFDGAKLYNTNRHLLGYTGSYRGVPVSVQTTGMGCPSLAIVVEEIIKLGARQLIRIGTCGAVAGQVAPGDLVVATASVANEGTSRQYLAGKPHASVADFTVTRALEDAATRSGRKVHVGLIQTEDAFYATSPADVPAMAARGVLAIEMEASALFTLGALRQVSTGCMLVTSNNIGDDRLIRPEDLKAAVIDMVRATLEAVVALRSSAPS
ncbi:MAG TPA: purine-nucleoside phosphorylase [Trueperaceae bacterium]|nr:purine-nucleoside phosphorylase [Trueperaceae bacterium]